MAHIVVGVDASETERIDLRWALDRALDGDRVEIVHVWNIYAVGGFEAPHVNPADVEVAAVGLLRRLVDEVATPADQERLDLVLTQRHGHSSEVLLEKSGEADLVVVGSRGHGGFKEMLLGSVSSQLVHHAKCPVVVVPPTVRMAQVETASEPAENAG